MYTTYVKNSSFYPARRNTSIGEYQDMNSKKANRRVDRTRKLLQEALVSLILEKGYEKITVQNVIDCANVSRPTFYAHFQDMDDLLLSLFDGLGGQLDQHLDSQPIPAADPWELTLLMFQHAQAQRLLYRTLIGGRGGDIMLTHINQYASELIREHLSLHLSDRNSEVIPSEILSHYIVSSFMALLTWWLDHDLPYPAEQMNAIFQELTEHGIEPVLDQSGSVAVQLEMLSTRGQTVK